MADKNTFEQSLAQSASDELFNKIILQVLTGIEQPFSEQERLELTGLQQQFLTKLSPEQETAFGPFAQQVGFSNSPLEFFDARGLFNSGQSPDDSGHSSSAFKLFGNPRTFVDQNNQAGALNQGAFDTRSGEGLLSLAKLLGERGLLQGNK